MSPEALQHCAGSSVNIQINDRKALGVLRLAADGSPYVTALCYVDPNGECPMLSRTLDAQEIASLKELGSFHLDSSITFTAQDEPLRISAVDRMISGGESNASRPGPGPGEKP